MKDKKHIDRLFQEKLKDFEVFPNAEAWKNIEKQLVKKKKRKIFPLWLRFGSAAAILLFLVTSSVWFYNSEIENPKLPDTNSIITDVNTEEKENELEERVSPAKIKEQTNTNQEENEIITPAFKGTLILKNKNTTRLANTNTTNEVSKSITKDKTRIPDVSKSTLAQTKEIEYDDKKKTKSLESIGDTEITIASTTNKQVILDTQEKKDINEALKEEKESIALEENASNENKWSIGSTVAPVYYNTLSKGSPIHSILAENEKSSITSISYGIKVNYKINNKLSLQSGINSLDLAYQTKNVSALGFVTSTNGLSNDTNINTNVGGIKIVAMSNDDPIVQSRDQEFGAIRQNGNLANLNGDLNQSFSYIEVPMEAKYTILQKKLGVNVIGGLSTYLLYNKVVTLKNESGSTTLGEASNINDVNFSGNVGLDLDYSINKKLYINVSPMFKYQFNTFSKNDGGFKPYYVGVYTGLNFRF